MIRRQPVRLGRFPFFPPPAPAAAGATAAASPAPPPAPPPAAPATAAAPPATAADAAAAAAADAAACGDAVTRPPGDAAPIDAGFTDARRWVGESVTGRRGETPDAGEGVGVPGALGEVGSPGVPGSSGRSASSAGTGARRWVGESTAFGRADASGVWARVGVLARGDSTGTLAATAPDEDDVPGPSDRSTAAARSAVSSSRSAASAVPVAGEPSATPASEPPAGEASVVPSAAESSLVPSAAGPSDPSVTSSAAASSTAPEVTALPGGSVGSGLFDLAAPGCSVPCGGSLGAEAWFGCCGSSLMCCTDSCFASYVPVRPRTPSAPPVEDSRTKRSVPGPRHASGPENAWRPSLPGQ